jgi:hypothetical protein
VKFMTRDCMKGAGYQPMGSVHMVSQPSLDEDGDAKREATSVCLMRSDGMNKEMGS